MIALLTVSRPYPENTMLRTTFTVLALAAALVACGKKADDPAHSASASASATAKLDKDGKPATPVKLLVAPEDMLTIASSELASGPVVTGSIQPERKADLRAEISAIVLQVMKDNGEAVKRGDVLLRLDDTSIRDSLTSAEAAVTSSAQALDQSNRQLERLKTLRASGMTSASAFDDAEVHRNTAQSDLSAARAREVSARQQLARTTVRAPFDGVVSDRKVSNGDTAAIGKELLKVIDPTSMRFEGHVSADRISLVKIGQTVMFRINGYGDQQFAGTVKRIDPAANAVTRQVEVLIGFANATQPKVSGLYAEGRIDAENNAALMLPESAIVRTGDKAYAWRIKGNKLNKVDVVLGARDVRTGDLAVTTGLAAGDQVLRSPTSNLADGQQVEMAAAKVASVAPAVQRK
jgi:RND family efflux transporter MFP subunit